VTRLGGCYGCADGGQVAQFADYDYVWVVAEGMNQGGMEGAGTMPQFPLLDDALIVAEQKLDGVFDGDNVSLRCLVEVIEHGCQGGGLAASSLTGYQDESSGLEDKLFADLGQAQFIYGWYPERYEAEGEAYGASLFERADAELGKSMNAVGEIQLQFAAKDVSLLFCGDLFEYGLNIIRRYRRQVFQGYEFTLNPQYRRTGHFNMQV